MNNPEEQQTESPLIDIMKKRFEEDQDNESSNKFPSHFQPESFNNNANSENSQNKNKQENEPNYDFLNAGGDKLISSLNQLNLGNNNSSNPSISPKKLEPNFFQNPMANMNINNKNNQDLAFNYYFGSGMQNDSSKKIGENNVSSQILEHLRFNNDNDVNEQNFKNYFNKQGNDNNNQKEDEKIENNIFKFGQNNIGQNQPEKMMINMNFQNKNNINQKLGLNENMIRQNKNINMNNLNNLNVNNQKQLNNINMDMGGNLQFNQMDPRIRNMIQQNMMINNMMLGKNNTMQMNQYQNQLLMNNQNNMNNMNNMSNMNNNMNNMNNNMNQKGQNQNKNKKKKNKNNKTNNNNNNNNNVNIQNMNLIMNQQQPQMINYQNYNQFIPNQLMQNKNSMINYPSSSNQNKLNLNNRGFIPNNNSLNMNLNNLQNIKNYNMNMQQQNKYTPQVQNEGGFIQNSFPIQLMNNNMGMNMNFSQLNLEQLINRANNTFPGKFYVIKCIDESNIISSIKFKIWCSTIKGNQKLQKAYKEADKKYPIILFFSVNGSGKFMGIALMNSDVEYKVNFNYWSQTDKWKGFFLVEWICIKDVPNRLFRNIINDLNENKPVTSSRDTQEISTAAGIKMLKVFKDYPQESTIFDSQPNEVKYMFQQSEQNNNLNLNNLVNMNNNMGNMNSISNMSNNGNNIGSNISTMNTMSNMGNMSNMPNLNNNGNRANIGGNIGNMINYSQIMKMNPRALDKNYENNNIMNNIIDNNMINNRINLNNNIGMGNNMNMNNNERIQMEMNNQEKISNNGDGKNSLNKQYDIQNILGSKNDEDNEGDNDN